MLRADMDALPVAEENEVPYASRTDGLMHACGHDGHMAILLAAAAELKAEGVPRGEVKLCFQPGEEGFRGAEKVIDDGALDGVDGCFGLHVWRDVPVGKVAIVEGPCMAATDTFTITITGKGGHAAMPHLSVDPVVVAAHVVTAFQTIVSRQVDPLDTAVVTVGSIESGSTFYVIPEEAVLRGVIAILQGTAYPSRLFGVHVHNVVHVGAYDRFSMQTAGNGAGDRILRAVPIERLAHVSDEV